MSQRESPEPWRQGVVICVIGYAKSSLKFDRTACLVGNFGKAKDKPVVLSGNHWSQSSLPIAIPDLTCDSKNCVIWRLLQFAYQIRKELGGPAVYFYSGVDR